MIGHLSYFSGNNIKLGVLIGYASFAPNRLMLFHSFSLLVILVSCLVVPLVVSYDGLP